eukprot:sb/3462204/
MMLAMDYAIATINAHPSYNFTLQSVKLDTCGSSDSGEANGWSTIFREVCDIRSNGLGGDTLKLGALVHISTSRDTLKFEVRSFAEKFEFRKNPFSAEKSFERVTGTSLEPKMSFRETSNFSAKLRTSNLSVSREVEIVQTFQHYFKQINLSVPLVISLAIRVSANFLIFNISKSVNRCFRMNDFDDVTNREEFDSTMARTVFSDRSGGQGCVVLRRLLDAGKAPDGITKDQLWILLMKNHSLLPSGTRSRFDSSGSSAADISIGHGDLLKESFESLKSDLLSTIERKVEDKVTAILQKTVPNILGRGRTLRRRSLCLFSLFYIPLTIPIDDLQTKALRELLVRLNLTFIGLFYENSPYGIGLKEMLELDEEAQLLSGQGRICMLEGGFLLRSDSTYTYQEEVKQIVMATEITAVAIFGYRSDMNKVREAFLEHGTSVDHYIWIASDGWTQFDQTPDLEKIIGTTFNAGILPDFRTYYNEIMTAIVAGNATGYHGNDETLPVYEKFAGDSKMKNILEMEPGKENQTNYITPVVEAVYAFAEVLRNQTDHSLDQKLQDLNYDVSRVFNFRSSYLGSEPAAEKLTYGTQSYGAYAYTAYSSTLEDALIVGWWHNEGQHSAPNISQCLLFSFDFCLLTSKRNHYITPAIINLESIRTLTSSDFSETSHMLKYDNGGTNTAYFRSEKLSDTPSPSPRHSFVLYNIDAQNHPLYLEGNCTLLYNACGYFSSVLPLRMPLLWGGGTTRVNTLLQIFHSFDFCLLTSKCNHYITPAIINRNVEKIYPTTHYHFIRQNCHERAAGAYYF